MLQVLPIFTVLLSGCVFNDPTATRQSWDDLFQATEDMALDRKDDHLVGQVSYDGVGFPQMMGVTFGKYLSPDSILEGTYAYGNKRNDTPSEATLPGGYETYTETRMVRAHLQ